jgi:hypothetical protein
MASILLDLVVCVKEQNQYFCMLQNLQVAVYFCYRLFYIFQAGLRHINY